jgi:pimeloyl-ACP methyl ester carboxylesterase
VKTSRGCVAGLCVATRVALLGSALFGTGCLSFHRGPLPGAPKDASYADIDGVRIRYKDEGQGPAVVLLHGFASSLETWETVTPTLKKTHRVLSLDLKGFGWSERPEGDYSPAAQAKLVLGLMKLRGIEHADLVAHSWGSSVALATTLADPKKIERLALYDAWVYEDQLPTFFLWARAPGVGETLFALFYDQRSDERMAHAFYDKKFITEPFVEAVDRALERPGTLAAALAATRGQHFADVESKYRTVRNKTLLLWGREDEVTLLPYGERLSKDLPNAKLVVYPQCGHFPMIEAASASTRDLDQFLETTPTTNTAPSVSDGIPN